MASTTTAAPAASDPDWRATAARAVALRESRLPRSTLLPASSPYASPLEAGGPADVLAAPRESGLLTADELRITEMEVEELLAGLGSGALRAVDVVGAFCKRAAIAQQVVNCLTEIFFDEGLARAAELDRILAKTGKPVGPLHGLPISLKDNFKVKGKTSSVGYVAWAERIEDEDSALVEILREQGAVLYCKTNVPTSLMHGDTYNNLYGYTCSPLNRHLSAGGSSGGEAALIKLRGSPLGVGTDIGGSVRIPAAACALYGLRPSFGRFPTLNHRSAMPGQETIRNVNGPISASIGGLEAFSRAVVGAQGWLEHDPRLLPIPWREAEVPQKLTFAVLYEDGVVRPQPPVRRAVKDTVDKLRAAGHEVIEWPHDPRQWLAGLEILRQAYGADGGDHIREAIEASGEPWIPGLKLIEEAKPPGMSMRELWALHMQKDAFQKQYAQVWNSTAKMTSTGKPVDGIIAPVFPYCSAPRYKYDWVAYTSIFNLLDYSAMVFPHSRVDPAVDVKDTSYQPTNDYDKAVHEMYDPELQRGGAVGVQIIGRRLEEEKVLAMGKAVVEALGIGKA